MDPDEIIPEDELPFTRFKPPPDEEDIDTIRTSTRLINWMFRNSCSRVATAWVVDVSDFRHLAPLLKYVSSIIFIP